ncbi:unnamed protein product, partial [Pocillopora meandrina]
MIKLAESGPVYLYAGSVHPLLDNIIDVTELKANAEKRKKADNVRRSVEKTLKQYANEQQYIRMDTERQVEPIVTAQKEVEMFRSSEYCTRYEYVSVDLQKPVVTPDKKAFQKRDIADEEQFGPGDVVATIDGSHSIINVLKMEFNGVKCIDTPSIYHEVKLKNPVEFPKDYSDKVGPTTLDTNTASVNEVELEFITKSSYRVRQRRTRVDMRGKGQVSESL